MRISDELWDSIPGNGWLTREEGELLLEVAGLTSGPILEVGCYYGRSTCLLASLNRLIYCVDPFSNFDTSDPSGDKVRDAFLKNLIDRHIGHFMLFRMPIEEWKSIPVEFAYLDGDHTKTGTIRQIRTAAACGVKELCIHDYDTRGGGLAIHEAIQESNLELVKVVVSMAHCRFKE